MGHLLFRWPWIHPAPASRLVEDSAMFYPLGLSRMDRMSLTPIFNSDGCRTVTRHENLPKPTRDGYGIGDGSGFCHSGSQARSGNYSIYDESRLIILRHHSLTHCHMGRRPIRTQSAFSHSHFTTTSYPHATIWPKGVILMPPRLCHTLLLKLTSSWTFPVFQERALWEKIDDTRAIYTEHVWLRSIPYLKEQ